MKTQYLFLTVAIVWFSPFFAGAAPPRPPKDCGIDKDGDGWCVPDASRTMPDPADATKTVAFHFGTEDCNDVDKAVNPGAVEKFGDGIDNDCDTDTDDDAPAHAGPFCGRSPSASCVKAMEAEIEACDANTAACVVNYTTGRYVTSYGWYFIDRQCNGDNVRELIDQDAFDEWVAERRSTLRDPKWAPPKNWDGRCTGRRSGGASKPATDPKLLERMGKAEQAVVVHEDAIKLTSGRVDKVESALASNAGRLDGLDTALAAETAERKAEDERLTKGIEKVAKAAKRAHNKAKDAGETANEARITANDAKEKANTALSLGIYTDVALGYMLKLQKGMEFKGKTLRGGIGQAGLVLARVGAELPHLRLLLTGGLAIISDEGPAGQNEGGLVGRVGPELDFRFTDTESFDVGLGYLHHSSGGDVVGSNAESRDGYLEVGYSWSPLREESHLRTPVRLAFAVVGGEIGTRGTKSGGTFRGADYDIAGMLTFTVGAGIGPLPQSDDSDDSDEGVSSDEDSSDDSGEDISDEPPVY